jgi:hypothetical protein
MALQLSGPISLHDVKTELGYPLATEIHLKTRLFGGKVQTYVGGTWIDLNQCSTLKPKTTAPYELTDWYGYDHAEQCCTPPHNVRIFAHSPTAPYTTNLSVDANTGVGFYCTFEGSTQELEYIWETASAGGFGGPDNGQNTNHAGVYFGVIDPNSPNIVKCTVKNKCGQATSQIIRVINTSTTAGGCTPPTSAVLTSGGSTGPVTVAAGVTQQVSFNLTHNVSGTVSYAISGDKIDGNSALGNSFNVTFTIPAGQSGWVRITVSNPCGEKQSNVIQINTPTGGGGGGGGGNNQVGNTPQTATVTKVCPSGQTGSQHTKTIQANIYYADTQGDANALAYAEAESQATAEMNSSGTCTNPNTCPGQVTAISVSNYSKTTIQKNENFSFNINVTATGTIAAEITIWITWQSNTGGSENPLNVILNSGVNTFTFVGTGDSDFYVSLTVRLTNAGNCAQTVWDYTAPQLITVTPIANPTCNPNNWTNVGGPFCSGIDQYQGQQNECGDFRNLKIDAFSKHCGFFIANISCADFMDNSQSTTHNVTCNIVSDISPYNATYQMGYTYLSGDVSIIGFASSSNSNTAVVTLQTQGTGWFNTSHEGYFMFWCDVTVNGKTRRASKQVRVSSG